MARVLVLLVNVFVVQAFHVGLSAVQPARFPALGMVPTNSPTSLAEVNIETKSFPLSTGVTMQVQFARPPASNPKSKDKRKDIKPPLVFLHGSFHGSWCWAERFFPFFANNGYEVVALNWRGTGGTFAGDGVKKVKIMEHVADFEAFLNEVLPTITASKQRPVIICHSFGGLAVMKYLESRRPVPCPFSGIVTICSVPPSGNGKMTMRFLRRSLVDSWKITAGLAMKRCLTDATLSRQLFFGGEKKVADDGTVVDDYGVSDEDVLRYQEYFDRDSKATIDLFDLAKQLPSFVTDEEGRAPFVSELPPCLVVGATNDMIVDREGVTETAKYFGLEDGTFVDSPHDVMLGAKWYNTAKVLDQWIQEQVL